MNRLPSGDPVIRPRARETGFPAEALPPVASHRHLYIEGAFGTGKTDLGLMRLRWAMQHVQGHGQRVTLLVPSRYAVRRLRRRLDGTIPWAHSPCRLATFAGLMMEAVALAWPVLAEQAGYPNPVPTPRFLNLESAQHLLAPEIQERAIQGQFEAATRDHSPGNNRLLSQLVDNLSKAAMYGYSLDEAYVRLARAVPPGRFREGRLEALRTALKVSRKFRRNCLQQNLVSIDLLYELFLLLLRDAQLTEALVLERCRHLIAFECEELDYACHGFLAQILPLTDSSLCLADPHGGFRYFLGAYPNGLPRLATVSERAFTLTDPPDSGRTLMAQRIERGISGADSPRPAPVQTEARVEVVRCSPLDECHGTMQEYFDISHHDHFADTLTWTAETVATLVHDEGLPPRQVVILAPIVGNALRFTLEQELRKRSLEMFTHRPSRMLKDEPAVQALLALTCLAHPHWRLPVAPVAKRIVLQMCMQDLEGWRAHSLAQVWTDRYQPFVSYPAALQDRIGTRFGVRFDVLRSWLLDYHNEERYEALDVFLARLYDELLASPGFSFGHDADSTRIAHQLMRSAHRFRLLLEEIGHQADARENPFRLQGETGKIYVELIQAGLIGSLHLPDTTPPPQAIVLASAYNFILQGYRVEHQFWLDVNHQSWGHRMHQPLTHPHVLEPSWNMHRTWGDVDEDRVSQMKIRRFLVGLLRRAGRKVHVAVSTFGETGHDQRGPLVRTLNAMLVQEAYTAAESPDHALQPSFPFMRN